MRPQTQKKIKHLTADVIALLCAAIIMFPFFWIFVSVFKTDQEAFAVPFRFFGSGFYLENFRALFNQPPPYSFLTSLMSTALVAGIAVIGSLLLNSLAAYVFARISFPGKGVIWWYFLITMFIPGITILLTSFQIVADMNMLNTIFVLVLPGLVSAFHIFFLRQFFLLMPDALEEAALIDGCGHFKIYRKIFLPMSVSPMVIVGASVFIGYWNSFIWPLITITNNPTLMQIMPLMQSFHTRRLSSGVIVAGTILSLIGPITMFALIQRKIVQGISLTGLK